MSDETANRVAQIVRSNRYLTLSTSSLEEGVWSTPLAYHWDEALNFHFFSETTSRHARQIRGGEKVAFSIYDSSLPSSDVDGIQILALCEPLPDEELEAIHENYFRQSFPDPEERRKWQKPIDRFLGNSPQKFYRLSVEEIYIIDLDYTEADRRVQVQKGAVLAKLR